MVAATLMWIADSGRLREPLKYCHLFEKRVHSQTALKYAYLKAMSYPFCCMVEALGKSPNQSPPNFKSLWIVASKAFFTFIGAILYLIWISWKWRICSKLIIKRHKWGWNGHTLRKDESSVDRKAMELNPLDGIGRRNGRPCVMWRRTVERECKNIN